MTKHQFVIIEIVKKGRKLMIEGWLKKEKNIAIQLAKCGSFIPRIKLDIDTYSNEFDEYAAREVACLIDYVILYFSEGKDEYRSLYIGERLKMSYDKDASVYERNERLIEFMTRDKQVFIQALSQNNDEILKAIIGFFDGIISQFQIPTTKELRVLFIGDCLHQDVMGTLSELVVQHGTAISPYIISTKNIFQLHKELENLRGQEFNAIFYSPLSYDYNISFSALLHYKNTMVNGFKLAETLLGVVEQIEKISDKLLMIFDCPIFIHNTACIIRDESRLKLLTKSILTMRLRKHAMRYIDARLRQYIDDRNSTKSKQLFLVDELDLLKQFSVYKLGKYIYRSALQHPTKFGMLIAEKYDRILFVLAHLYSKKLIVCDLDNTLWDGVIGEGEVNHFVNRQEILIKLKSKGILLAINSKNDPNNIHWRGGVLSDKDFVYQSISWEAKIKAFPKMQAVLNLKMKDFIFIDDRLDELEFVRSAYPSIQCLDALNQGMWQALELWGTFLDAPDGMDRTQMYKEREHRGDFLKAIDENTIDEAEMFKELGLVLTLRPVKKSELKRALELINRTNQFNIRGSRTNFNEAQQWLDSDSITMLQASMADKFGDMGVVSIIVFEKKGNSIEVLVFVLSCRVFGYKVEVAILNEVKRFAQQQGVKSIQGEYITTASNAPCSLVYSDAGFTEKEKYWECLILGNMEFNEPEWIEVITG